MWRKKRTIRFDKNMVFKKLNYFIGLTNSDILLIFKFWYSKVDLKDNFSNN